MDKGTLRQILLITDGGSNAGEDPVEVSRWIAQKGLSVNVIGVLNDDQTEHPPGLKEIEAIAEAGAGVSRLVYARELPETVQMVTQQAITQTIQGFIQKEVQAVFGQDEAIETLSPDTRGELQVVVEELGETCEMEVLVLVDTSASMKPKLEDVKEAIDDLALSLSSRVGENALSIYHFPTKKAVIDCLLPWTHELKRVNSVFPKLTTGGVTPTGDALRRALEEMNGAKGIKSKQSQGELEDERNARFG